MLEASLFLPRAWTGLRYATGSVPAYFSITSVCETALGCTCDSHPPPHALPCKTPAVPAGAPTARWLGLRGRRQRAWFLKPLRSPSSLELGWVHPLLELRFRAGGTPADSVALSFKRWRVASLPSISSLVQIPCCSPSEFPFPLVPLHPLWGNSPPRAR